MNTGLRLSILLGSIAATLALPGELAQTQAPAPATPSSSAPAKPLAFDAVSIRPAKSSGGFFWSTTPDGYTVPGQSLYYTVMIAYFPQGWFYWSRDRLSGAPSWLNEPYDINAKVSEADLAQWQKQGLSLDKKPMLRQMLQTMLADRCDLVAHMVPGPPIPGWSLEPGKRTPRLTESRPGATLPAGVPLASGGVMVYSHQGDELHWSFYNATMEDFAQYLSSQAGGHPVLNHTGRTGRYDFVLDWAQNPDSKLPVGVTSTDDPDPLSHWNTDALGFRLVPVKIPADTLVIDHIEKPSEN